MSVKFDVDRAEVSILAHTGQQILEQHTQRAVPFSKQGIETMDDWMIHLWKELPPDPDDLSDEEQELLGYLAAFLGECIIETLGGQWGRLGPFFDMDYFVRIPIPCGLPYDINPGIRVTKSYYDPVHYSIKDWYLRAELASLGLLDPLLQGIVQHMIVPSMLGRVVIQRHPDQQAWVYD
ncbi:MAG: hypothetical protein JWN30_2224 [Bacilli bacterium]|nr:hypothetical protein [Bacilli bacterium]